jgi:hypothetical protein
MSDEKFVSYPTDPTQMTILVGRRWKLWATRRTCVSGPRAGEIVYWYIGTKRWVDLLKSRDPVVPVLVEEVLGNDYAPEVTHYGWEDADQSRESPSMSPSMIQVRTGASADRAMMFLDMCFPYGLKLAVEKKTGRVVALRITERAEETTP